MTVLEFLANREQFSDNEINEFFKEHDNNEYVIEVRKGYKNPSYTIDVVHARAKLLFKKLNIPGGNN